MGNTNRHSSDVAEDVKKQADSQIPMYKLVDLSGGGELIDLMKKAIMDRKNEKDLRKQLGTRIKEAFEPHLYETDERYQQQKTLREIWKSSTADAKARNSTNRRQNGSNQTADNQTDHSQTADFARSLLDRRDNDGDTPLHDHCRQVSLRDILQARCRGKTPVNNARSSSLCSRNQLQTADKDADQSQSGGKMMCWRLDARGSVGETPLHVCLLKATFVHIELAKLMLEIYPGLAYDYYIHDEFYGENALHMAIVNEDPAMVKLLLNIPGVDVHQRCCGKFFTPADQQASRRDSDLHEWFDVPTNTNYEGNAYWGEYPLSFAACLGQEECVRLLCTKDADVNKKDTNGNTALHMVVIHDKEMRERMATGKSYCEPEVMFDLLISLGAKPSLNAVNKRGLTPLTLAATIARSELFKHIMEIDREVYWEYANVSCAGYPLQHIDTISDTGKINTKSVMYKVVYGDEHEHLDMFDGVLEQLLSEKWKKFGRSRFYRRFFFFVVYFVVFSIGFGLREIVDPGPSAVATSNSSNSTENYYSQHSDPCYLLRTNTTRDKVRMTFECLTLLGSVIYIVLSLREILHQGYRVFFRTLYTSPGKTMLLISNCIILLMIPCRPTCSYTYENVLIVIAALCTCPYFLFFCRGFRIVGPFVVMIYKMIHTDLLRFFAIYLVFLIGFSQAMFVLFRGYDNDTYSTWIESMLGMFRMSLGAFGEIYENFDESIQDPVYIWFPRIIFVIYMILVTLLLVNMLIAMMGHTYETVNESQKEWYRQWAKIILIIEQTLTTEARSHQQLRYSQPMKDQRRALPIRRDRREGALR